MGFRITRLVSFVCFACCAVLSAQSRPSSEPQKLDRLIVYGNNFAFGVKEPAGWTGDTEKEAAKHRVNIIFFPAAKDSKEHDVTIRVRVNHKVDENTIEDLNYDMQGYKTKFANATFENFNVKHPEYKTFSKLVFVPTQFYEYVAYLNPGTGASIIFSVAMSKKKTPATPDELKAYEVVLQSLQTVNTSR